MNSDRLEAFLAVVEHGSFRVAAQMRSVTQPALTKQIQALERAVGARLLDRSRHGTVPTAAGRSLIPRAHSAVAAVDDFWEHARKIASGDAGSVSVGFGMSGLRRVPAVIERFRRQHPDVQVSIEDLSSDIQQRWVASGRLDVGFGREPTLTTVSYTPVWSDRLAVATTDPVVTPERLASWLDQQRVVRLAHSKGPGLAAQIEQLERRWQVHPETLTVTHDLLTVIAMAQAGVGPAIIPQSAMTLAQDPLRVISIDDHAAAWTIGPIWRPDSVSPPTQRLIQLALGTAESAPGEGIPRRRR